jgi:plasmid stability protein
VARFRNGSKTQLTARTATVKSLTIKNIPDLLHEELKRSAKRNHRSINSEIIACLERELMPQRVYNDEEISERLRLHREKLAAQGFFAPEPEVLKAWIEEGRE